MHTDHHTFFKAHILPLQGMLYRQALRVVGRQEEAEDVVQEVLAKLWTMRTHWADIENMEAWTTRAVRNLSIDRIRRLQHRHTVALPEHWDAPAAHPTPYEAMVAGDALARVRTLMQRLPPKQRDVMALRDLEDMGYQDIADALDMPLGQVKTNLFRARQTLRTWMEQG